MLLREIIAVYSDNKMKYINKIRSQNTELFNAEVDGTYRYHCALKNTKIMYRFNVFRRNLTAFLRASSHHIALFRDK
jgi:hypothetical protein